MCVTIDELYGKLSELTNVDAAVKGAHIENIETMPVTSFMAAVHFPSADISIMAGPVEALFQKNVKYF